ncbi:MAG: hypothetical protein ACM31N_09080 [Deltaproteobacteria bacterium]
MNRIAAGYTTIRDRFLTRIRTSFLVRFHMAIILIGTALSGILYSKILLELNLHSMVVRFPIAVALSYLTFFLFVKLWLGYVSRASAQSKETADGVDVADALFLSDGVGAAGPDPVSFGGGGSGGGGAGGSFAAVVDKADSADSSPVPASVPATAATESSSAASKGAKGASALLEFDDAAAVLAVLALAAAVVAIAGGYLIYDAPNILPDAAWEAALAAGLFRGARRMNAPDWAGSVFRATWKPFACILAICFLVGFVGGKIYPEARSVLDLWRLARAAP